MNWTRFGYENLVQKFEDSSWVSIQNALFFPTLRVWAFFHYIPTHFPFSLGMCLSLAIVPNLFILFCPNLSHLKPKAKVTTNSLANMICNSPFTNMASKSSMLDKFSMLVKVFTKTILQSNGMAYLSNCTCLLTKVYCLHTLMFNPVTQNIFIEKT